MYKSQVSRICQHLGLTPFQTYILERNAYKYNLGRLVKRGNIVYAPYLPSGRRLTDIAGRILFGPRADLIGPDRVLACGQRGVELYADGRYVVHQGRIPHYVDIDGRPMTRTAFLNAVHQPMDVKTCHDCEQSPAYIPDQIQS